MRILTLALVFIISVMFPLCVRSQTEGLQTADSLLLLGQLGQVDSLLQKAHADYTVNPPDSSLLKDFHTYRELFDDLVQYVAQIAQVQPDALAAVAGAGRKSAYLFAEARAGRLSADAYARFESIAQSGPSVEAAKYLRIARMFKIRYTERTLDTTRRMLNQAREALDHDNLELATSTLDSITWTPEHRQTAPELADSLTVLSEKVNRAVKRVEQRKYLWDRQEVVTRRYTISLVSHLAVQAAGDPMPLAIHNDTSSRIVTLNEKEARFPFMGGIQVWRSLNEKFQAGITLYTTQYKFTSNLDPHSFATKFDVRHWYGSVSGRYLFRSSVGLRPYIDLGLGLRYYKQKESECVVLALPEDTTEAAIPNRYVLDARSGSTALAAASLGVQFVSAQNSRFGISSEASFYYSMKTGDLVDRLYVTFGLHLDLLL